MDINALLSPDEGNASAGGQGSGGSGGNLAPEQLPSVNNSTTAPRTRPGLGASRRTASSLSYEVTRSPEHTTASPPRSTSAHGSHVHNVVEQGVASAAAPNFRPLPPTSNPVQATAVETPPPLLRYGYAPPPHHQRPVAVLRHSSTPQMETLADLTSMQQHRPPPPRAFSSNNVRQADFAEQQRSPLAAPPISRSISRQSLADLTMAEAPAQTPPPRDFTSAALSDTESKTVTDLLSHLANNSYAYMQHVELINLLHKGFIAHVATSNSSTPQDPHGYALLTELRQAREAMDSRFAVGEAIWVDWLSDEVLLASSSEERIAVTELFSKAVQDVPASVKLWLLYIDWISANFAACYDLEGDHRKDWSAEDNEMCRELFTKDMLLNVLEQAVSGTQWRIDESHIIWNRYAEFVQGEFPQSPSPDDIERLRGVFMQRLQMPHAAWNDTAQTFWSIASRFENDGHNWESLMEMTRTAAEPANRASGHRREREYKLQRVLESEDDDAMQAEFESYFRWEKNIKPKHATPFDHELRGALYERALLKFPTQTAWWLSYIDYKIASPATPPSQSLLPIIERATRHCPWSGDLWGRRILRADVEKKPRDEIEATKHRATNSGLLDLGGLEEMVKMLQQWCSYLRRHAFSTINSEDDLDTAEVGIIAALENVKSEGKKIYGPNFQGDPLFRLEQTQIKFLTEGRRVKDARAVWRGLVKHLSSSFNFWSKYYNWELWLWGYDRMTEQHRVETAENGPHLATQVVQEALSQSDLDRPEMVLEMYLYHFQQHDSAERLQDAIVEARQFSDRLTREQAHKAEEAAHAAAQQDQEHVAASQTGTYDGSDTSNLTKRKREDESGLNGESSKRSRTDEDFQGGYNEPSASASAQIKRDREHNTVTLRNLPPDVQETDIKEFFRGIGKILSIYTIKAQDGESASATVEFPVQDDALYAKTRDGREIGGRQISISGGGQNTLYVCNYPAQYDENAIRDLFKNYGDITSVRFPSLKYNSRRRFCYVTFLTAEMSHAAEQAMDGTKLDNIHSLIAKISDPTAARQRSGAMAEGREICVRNLDPRLSEQEVKEFFAEYGSVVSVKLLKRPKAVTGFIVYGSADQASIAVEKANLKPFHNHVLQVSIASNKGGTLPAEQAKKKDIIVSGQSGFSASPEPGHGPGTDSRRSSDVSMNSTDQHNSAEAAKARKAAIMNLPDTVNDARIRAVMERYGPITKIQLRREQEGAIVDFADAKDAFNVRQGVDVSALGSDVATGDVQELFAKSRNNRKLESTNGSGSTLVPSSAIRPGALRGGRKTGLGFRPGGASSVIRSSVHNSGASNKPASGGVKTNADFRNMLQQSKEEKSEPADE